MLLSSVSVGGLRQLGPSARAEAYAFCEASPDRATYIAGWIKDGGLERSTLVPRGWLLADMRGSAIDGLVYVSNTGIVIPVAGERALDDVADIARANPNAVRVVVGEREVVASLFARLERLGMEARICRDQLGYAVERDEFRCGEQLLPLLVARSSDLDELVEASAAMAREEANDDPQARNPELFRSRIAERVARGRDFIHRPEDELLFKTNVAALSPVGGQIEGIYTNPNRRRERLGFRGTAAITSWVLERAERAVLLVNEDNHPARELYERLGYRRVLDSRTIFIAP
jgi:predicted GNAT family acetyltransferase